MRALLFLALLLSAWALSLGAAVAGAILPPIGYGLAILAVFCVITAVPLTRSAK